MDLIDLDEDTIDAEVLNFLRITMENLHFPFGTSNTCALCKTVIEVLTLGRTVLPAPMQYLSGLSSLG
jgi:hypothetical protein